VQVEVLWGRAKGPRSGSRYHHRAPDIHQRRCGVSRLQAAPLRIRDLFAPYSLVTKRVSREVPLSRRGGLCPGRQYKPAGRGHRGTSSPPIHPCRRRANRFLWLETLCVFGVGLTSTPSEVIQRCCSWPPFPGRYRVGKWSTASLATKQPVLLLAWVNSVGPTLNPEPGSCTGG
jgi:hypothetical protein